MYESNLCSKLSLVPKAVSLISLFTLIALYGYVAHAGEYSEIPSITADRVVRDTRTGDVISIDRIQLSPKGLRARQSGVDSPFEYLQNTSLQKIWMLDWSRKILHELGSAEQMPEGTTIEGRSFAPYIATIEEQPQSSVMAVEPCIDLIAVEVGLAKWRGQTVSVWRCDYAGGESYSQLFFSEIWNLVVREERSDQKTIELSNIKLAEFLEGNFRPPDYFRHTDFRELIIGSPLIGNYSE